MAHAALVVWLPGCAVAAWWQVGIALGGDSLGWVYSVMWPCFAVFGIVFWWFLIHDDPDTVGARGLRRAQQEATNAAATSLATAATGGPSLDTADPSGPAAQTDTAADIDAQAEATDPDLAAYNEYLAALADRPKTWRRSPDRR